MATSWEQREDESDQAFGAFARYRDTPAADRSLRALAQSLNKQFSLMTRWSARDDWIRRARAYDMYLDDLRRAAAEKEIQEMVTRQAKIGMAMQGIAQGELVKLQKLAQQLAREVEDEEGAVPEAVMGAADLIRMLEAGVRIERLARGEAEEIKRFEVGRGDPLVRAIVEHEDVRAGARELVRRAAGAREGVTRRIGPGDESGVRPTEAS